MQNVLDITPRLPERPPLDVELPLQIITRLLQVGQISRHAHGVGAYVLSKMQATGEYSCTVTRAELVNAAVSVDGQPLVKLNCPEIDEFAVALHALQANCGLWNHIQEHRVGKGTVRYNHFSERYRGAGDFESLLKVMKADTLIHFLWIPEQVEELLEDVRARIAHGVQVARWADITTVRFN